MNYLDIIILIPAIWAGFRGFKNGLVKEVFSLIAFIAGIWCACNFSGTLASNLDSPAAPLTAFAIIFVAALVATYFVGRFIDRVIKIVVPDFVDRLCGICFGVLKVLMVCSIFLFFIQKADSKGLLLKTSVVQESVLYEYVEKSTAFLTSKWDDSKKAVEEKKGKAY